MKINSISQANFGKIYIAENQNKEIALGILREMSVKDMEKFEHIIDRVAAFDNTNVVVNKNGDVYVEYKNKNDNMKKITIGGNVSLFTKYNMALHQALRLGN